MPHGGPKLANEAAAEMETTADAVGGLVGAVLGGAAGIAAAVALGPLAVVAPHATLAAVSMAIGAGAKAGVKTSKALREH